MDTNDRSDEVSAATPDDDAWDAQPFPATVWTLPTLFHIVSFMEAPTHRAHVLCHQLAQLCKASRRTLLSNDCSIWDAVLKSDYGVVPDHRQRRTSKRLRVSKLQQVQDAHLRIQENTEICYHFLTEMCSSRATPLSKARLIALLQQFGPHLRLNNRTASGGAFLVECCRARHVKESVVLGCVKELVENWGAAVDLEVRENTRHDVAGLTALCVAAARGMPNVLKYLLRKGSDPTRRCTGLFRLHTNPRRTCKCKDSTALEFAEAILQRETGEGATAQSLTELRKGIRLLRHGVAT